MPMGASFNADEYRKYEVGHFFIGESSMITYTIPLDQMPLWMQLFELALLIFVIVIGISSSRGRRP